MLQLIPGEDVVFLRVEGGKVHVVPPAPEVDEIRRIGDGPVDPIAHLLGSLKVLCGATIDRHRGGLEAHGSFTSEFMDDDLCARCYHAVAFEDRPRLFQHDIPA